MDLQGKIEKFNVPEIFQLISSGQRTGTLGIVRNQQATMFYFDKGQITYAYSPDGGNRLGARLINKGYINNEELKESLAEQAKTQGQKRLGQILIEAEKVDKKQVESILIEQISDIVYKVMGWDNGVFKFYDSKFPTEEDKSLSLSTERLILEGAKRADELSHLKQQLPDFTSILRLKKSENDDRVRMDLSTHQWNTLVLCDGSNTIEDIVNHSGEDIIVPLKSLVELFDLGLIESIDSHETGKKDLSHLELQVGKLADLINKFLAKA